MRFMKHLYVGENAERVKTRILRSIHRKKPQTDAYVIVPALNPADQLDILHANFLLQPLYQRQEDLVILGIAESKREAVNLILRITDDCLQDSGSPDLKAYLSRRVREEGTEEI